MNIVKISLMLCTLISLSVAANREIRVLQKETSLYFDRVHNVDEITLYSSAGKVMQHTSRVTETTIFSTRGLGRGVYFYRLNGAGGSQTGTVILQ